MVRNVAVDFTSVDDYIVQVPFQTWDQTTVDSTHFKLFSLIKVALHHQAVRVSTRFCAVLIITCMMFSDYVGWVRHKGDNWMKFDDDVVTCVTSDEILRLSGGGDWHVAYVLLYGPKVLDVPVEEPVEAETQMLVD